MKRCFVFAFFIFISVIVFSEDVLSQIPKQKNFRSTIVNKNTFGNPDTTQKRLPKDTTIKDKPVEFDLLRLSKLATVIAHSTEGAQKSGMVVLEIKIDESGLVQTMTTREGNDGALVKAAMTAVNKYMDRYNVEPAIKDGKYVAQEGILLPIVFDMTMFDK